MPNLYSNALITFISFSILALAISGCAPDNAQNGEFTVNVRLQSEPDRINPILSRVPEATEIENYIFLPLSEFDPFTLDFKPVLLESLPSRNTMQEGQFAGETIYDFTLRNEAAWQDGTPVTARDYLFTIKLVLNPHVPAADWRGFITNIKDIRQETNDPKSFQVIAEGEYMLTEEAISNINIYPEHIYDPDGLMTDVSLEDLLDPAMSEQISVNPNLIRFAESFNSATYSRDTIVGNGPYRFVNWTTNQSIVLEKVDDWWGEAISATNPMLSANPDRIVYHIIPDETAAISALKEGRVDIVSNVSVAAFEELKGDPAYAGQLDLLTPKSFRTFYIALNNKSPLLADKRTRQAFAYALDNDKIISDLFSGYGEPVIGPIHPDKPEYNRDLELRGQNPEKARQLLEEAGWSDTDQNGIVDHQIAGVRRDLSPRLFITASELSRNLALIIQQSLGDVGVNVEIVSQDFNTTLQNNLVTRDYEMAALVTTAGPTSYDPYQFWHTDSDRPDGSNFFSFGHQESDSLIDEIRTTLDPVRRAALQKQFQAILHEEQAVIFLCTELLRIVADTDLQLRPSMRRPGYFVNYSGALQ